MGTVNLKVATKFDGSQMQRGLNRAKAGVTSLGTKIKGMARGALKNWGAMAGAMATGVAIAKAREAISYGSKISDLALSMGITNERLQELEFVATRGGASVEDLQKAFVKLGQTSTDALAGNKEIVAAYERFGISIDDIKASSPEQLFMRLSESMKDAPRDLQFFDDSMLVLGKTATKILPTMALDFRKVAEEARRTGAIMSNDTIDQLDTMEDRIQELQLSITAGFGEAAVTIADLFKFGDKEAAYVEKGMSSIFGAALAAWDKDIDFGEAIRTAAQKNDLDMAEADLAAKRLKMEKAIQAAKKSQLEDAKRESELQRKLAEKRTADLNNLKDSMEKLAELEFKASTPEEQKAIIEKRLKAAKAEEAVAKVRDRIKGGRIGALLDVDEATKVKKEAADATIKRMELEAQLEGITTTPDAPAVSVGQDQLSRIGLFRGTQTEESIVANRQLERLKMIDENTLKVARGIENLVNP